MPAPTVNSQRLNATLEALGRIGESPEGMQRIALPPRSTWRGGATSWS